MRIASLAPSVTRQLQELGAADQVVACTAICPLPKAERQAKAVGTFSVLNEEKIAAAKPDLILTATLVQAKGAGRLQDAGYTVLHLDPRRLVEIADSYEVLGEMVGMKEKGEKLKREFRGRLTPSPSLRSGTPPSLRGSKTHVIFPPLNEGEVAREGQRGHLRVYMEEWADPPFVAGNWVPDLVAMAGGESVLIQPGEPPQDGASLAGGGPSREISLAELQEADPDVIIQHACLPPLMPEATEKDYAQRERHRVVMLERLKQRPGWDALRAVRAGRVYFLDDTPCNMPTMGVLKGIEMLREIFAAPVLGGIVERDEVKEKIDRGY